jgi:glycine/D-amino acid oxidase-like deaminating enzyme
MGPQVDPIATDEAAPLRTGVVIVGGGIIGASAAFFLARNGVPAVLCEKGVVAGEQSSRNWGWCRKMGRDPRELPLIIESLELWREMNEMVGAETGFRTTGILYLCDTDAEVARREAWFAHARQHQLDTRMVSPTEIASLLPGASRPFKAALYTPSDGRAEPQKAAPAIAAAARKLGASVLTNCAVRGVETAGGRVTAALTEKGRIACDAVILAGGAWSRLFCGSLGLRLPQLKVRSSVMRTAPLAGAPETAASSADFAFRKRLDGGYTISKLSSGVAEIVPDSFLFFPDFLPLIRIEHRSFRLRIGRRFIEEWRTPRRWNAETTSPFESVRTLDPEPVTSLNHQALAALTKRFPAFDKARIVQHWAGMIDVTPDVVPVISSVETLPGFVIATGFSGHGFGIGPAAGKLAAQLATGETPIVDPTPFRFSRFTDGSRPRPDPSV